MLFRSIDTSKGSPHTSFEPILANRSLWLEVLVEREASFWNFGISQELQVLISTYVELQERFARPRMLDVVPQVAWFAVDRTFMARYMLVS